MKRNIVLVGLVAAVALVVGADLLACGDKFLVGGRGTRYQRPKNFRAASILIYSNPSTGLEAALRKLPVEAVLKREGHRSTKVESLDQVSALAASGGFDVVIADRSDATAVESLLGGRPGAPVVLAVCPIEAAKETVKTGELCDLKASPKARKLLEAVDKAVGQHDRKAQTGQTHL
jgi:hypothetical protein